MGPVRDIGAELSWAEAMLGIKTSAESPIAAKNTDFVGEIVEYPLFVRFQLGIETLSFKNDPDSHSEPGRQIVGIVHADGPALRFGDVESRLRKPL